MINNSNYKFSLMPAPRLTSASGTSSVSAISSRLATSGLRASAAHATTKVAGGNHLREG